MKLTIASPKAGVLLYGDSPPDATMPRTGEFIRFRHLDLEYQVTKVSWYFNPTEVYIETT